MQNQPPAGQQTSGHQAIRPPERTPRKVTPFAERPVPSRTPRLRPSTRRITWPISRSPTGEGSGARQISARAEGTSITNPKKPAPIDMKGPHQLASVQHRGWSQRPSPEVTSAPDPTGGKRHSRDRVKDCQDNAAALAFLGRPHRQRSTILITHDRPCDQKKFPQHSPPKTALLAQEHRAKPQ